MITGTIIGTRELIARMTELPKAAKVEIDATVLKLGYELERRVKVDYLSGQVLKVRTGRLRSSIGHGNEGSVSHQETTATTSIYYVGTNVGYGVAWERGIAARDIVPVRAKALRFEIGGEVLFRKHVHIPAQPARPFLEPALMSMRSLIMTQLQAALNRGMQKALGHG